MRNVSVYRGITAAAIILVLAGCCGVILAGSIIKGTLCIAAGYAVEFLATAVYESYAVHSGKKDKRKSESKTH